VPDSSDFIFGIFGCNGYSAEKYFPLSEGMIHQYETISIDNNGNIKKRITSLSTIMAKRKVNNIIAIPVKKVNNIETSLLLKSFIYYLAKDDKGVFMIAIQNETDTEPKIYSKKQYFLLYPLKSGIKYNDDDQEIIIESIDDIITVQAGTFVKCIKISAHAKNNKSTWTRWFAPNIGLVKLIVTNDDGSRLITQLLSFTK